MGFVREKKIECGDYREVDIFNLTEGKHRGNRRRIRETCPAQKAMNEENSRRAFVQYASGNFAVGDLHVALTYDDKHLPDEDKARKQVQNFIRTLRRKCKKQGKPEIKYMLVSAVTEKDGEITRLHHHMILSCELTRDEIENAWKYGTANADRIQGEEGIQKVSAYLTRQMAGRKSWTRSNNLIPPVRLPDNDSKYSTRKIGKLAGEAPRDTEVYGAALDEVQTIDTWRKLYPAWNIIGYRTSYNELTGWAVYLRMRRRK